MGFALKTLTFLWPQPPHQLIACDDGTTLVDIDSTADEVYPDWGSVVAPQRNISHGIKGVDDTILIGVHKAVDDVRIY